MVRGDDTIDNSGDITATSVAEVPSVSVSFSLIGATAAVSSSTAESRAVAIDAGSGDDHITNSGELEATAVANANTVNISVAPAGGAIAGDTVWDGGTKATAEAIGISGDGKGTDYLFDSSIKVEDGDAIMATVFDSSAASGDDFIDNNNDITATSVAVAPSIGVAVAVGVAGAASTATAESRAAAIDAGGGNDIIDNSGELEAVSVANADAVSISVSGGGSVSSDAFWNGGTTAKSQAVGISGDGNGLNDSVGGIIAIVDDKLQMRAYLSSEAASGNDTITNTNKITATSVAVAPSVNIAASAGIAASIASATAESEAMAIDAGAGDDTIINSGELEATSVANADAIAATVLVSPFGAAVSANGIFDGGVTATSHAAGISGDGIGHDQNTTATVIVESVDDVRLNTLISTEAASGNDTITNDGKISATSVAVAPAVTVSLTLNGVAAAVSTATAEATAVAIDAGSGDDTVTNTGDLIVESVANADAVNITSGLFTVAVAADAVWSGGTTAIAKSVGISGDNISPDEITTSTIEAVDGEISFDTIISNEYAGGNDTITNDGNITTSAVVVAPSVSVAVAGVGIAAAMSTATAESTAIAIDGGAGDDMITNHGVLDVTSVANADAVSVSVTGIGASVAADAVWDGGTKATANAVGISGDGIGTNEMSEAIIEYKDNKVLLGLVSETEAVSGNDTITNTNTITTTSVAVTPSIGVAASGIGISAAMTTSTAEANSTAIDAGDGDDTVNNSGNLTTEAISVSTAVSVSASLIGVSGAGTAAWDGGTTAMAEAVGIKGDSHAKESTQHTINITNGDIVLGEETVRESTGGNDTIINSGDIEATAVAVTVSADVSLTGIGIAAAVSTSTADANATAIDAGAGDDTVTNTGSLIADADAVAVSVGLGIAPIGVGGASGAVWDGGTKAKSVAVGISGDGFGEKKTTINAITVVDGDVTMEDEITESELVGGNDIINNEGVIKVYSTAVAPEVTVAATVAGVSAALSTATAESYATAIDAGAGDDTLNNSGMLIVDSSATSVAVAVGVTGVGVAGGSDTVWEGGTTAMSSAIALDGGEGTDQITNEAAIYVNSKAEAVSVNVAADIAGVAAAFSASKAEADTTAISGGDGDDTIHNSASLVSSAESDATGVSVSVELIGYATADTSTTADAQSIGIDGGSGNDAICNSGNIWSSADATAEAAEVTVGFVGAGKSDSPVEGETKAVSNAIGITGGDDDDWIGNGATIALNSTADVTAAGVTVEIAGYSEADVSAAAEATATGIEGGGGNDALINFGTVTTSGYNPATSTLFKVKASAPVTSVTVTLAGASSADASTRAYANAVGMAGGDGNDMVFNVGTIDLDTIAEAPATSVTVELAGAGSANASATADAAVSGMTGGNGYDAIINKGTIDLTSTAKAPVSGTTVNLAGSAGQMIGSTTNVTATGIDAGSGNDFVASDGTITVKATADAKVAGVSFTLAGAASGTGTATAAADAAGISGGSGADFLYNEGGIEVDVESTLESSGDVVAVFGASGADATINGSLTAAGMRGDDGNDLILNIGDINVTSDLFADFESSAWNLAGASGTKVGMTANSVLIGIDGGQGNDQIGNGGSLEVTVETDADLEKSSWVLAGKASDSGIFTASGSATGISGGSGYDKIINSVHGHIGVDVDTDLEATGGSDAIFGSSSAGVTLTAESTAIGIDGGSYADLILNFGDIDVDSDASAETSSVAFTFIGGSSASTSLAAESSATGIIGGSGSDAIFNDGSITVNAGAELTASGGSRTTIGSSYSALAASAEAAATGIEAGSGNDIIRNSGSVVVDASVNPNSSNDTSAGGLFVDGIAKATATADTSVTVVNLGSGVNTLSNDGTLRGTTGGTATATADSDGGSWLGVDVDAKATATATVVGTDAIGISGGHSANYIANEGTLQVTSATRADANAYANGQSIISGDGTAWSYAYANNAKAYGISLGNGNNLIGNSGTITVVANPKAEAYSWSDADGVDAFAQPDSKAYATATANNALAVGIKVGYGNNQIQNEGTINVTALSQADKAQADAIYGGDWLGIDSFATTTARADNAKAYGILTGNGNNTIWNTGTINVQSKPKAIAESNADGVGWDGDAEARATVSADNALSVGIQTGSGADSVWNDGTIFVRTTPTTLAYVDANPGGLSSDLVNDGEKVEDGNTSFSNRQAIGISTGAGNDLIVNNGTIDALVGFSFGIDWIDDMYGYLFEVRGDAINSGSGSDTVVLANGSITKGNVLLGSGDDILNLTGTPSLTGGYAYGGTGTDTALLYGSGYFNGALLREFENGLKAGTGTYTVPDLPGLDILEVVEGRLIIDNDYQFNTDGKFIPHINPDGTCGILEINGIAELAGKAKIVTESGAFINGTDFNILASQSFDGGFAGMSLPNSLILTFNTKQSENGLNIEVAVASFETVADNGIESKIAEYLDRLTLRSSGELNDIIGEFQRLSRSDFDQAFASVNPESYINSAKVYMDTTRKSFDAIQDRLNMIRKTAAYTPIVNKLSGIGTLADLAGIPQKPVGFWNDGFAMTYYEDEPGIIKPLLDTNNFISLGFDSAIGNNLVVGFGQDYSEITTTSAFTDGDNTASGEKQFVYGSYTLDDYYMDAAFFYGNESYDHQRDITVGIYGGTAASNHESESFSSYVEIGKLLASGLTIFQPFASLEYVYFREDGFTESGGGVLALKIEDMERDLLISDLGIRVAKMWAVDSWTVMPEISLAWRYNIEPADYSTTASFVSAPGEYFVIDGKEDATHALDIGASLNIANYGKFRSILDFSGELFTDEDRYDVAWTLEYNW